MKTLGQHLLDDAVPAGYRPQGAWTRGALYKQMVRLAQDDPETYTQTIVRVKNLGDELATLEGISVGLDDIAPIHATRDAVMKPAITAFNKATTDTQRRKVVMDTQARLVAQTKEHPGTLGAMARSGGRGNQVQLMKTVGSPVAANDERDVAQPWLIRNSYSEGLKPADWWTANREARMAAVKSTIEVTEPGDLSKIIVNNTTGQVVTTHDCGSYNGLEFQTTSSEIYDRYLAGAAGGFPHNTLIDKRVVDELRKKNIAKVIVRSPMTCEASTGVCQLCMGRAVTGKLNRIGDNVGVRASHAMGEPLTQLALNAKHGVRTAGGAAGVSGLEGFRALIESPVTFKGKAALAPMKGTVTKIEAAPQGGTFFHVGEHRVHALPGLRAVVKAGDSVHAGDVLSEGTPRPMEVVALKGLGAGRDYLVNQLGTIYRDAGIDVDRRHLEILAKSTLNHMKVDKIGQNDHGVVRGDVITYNKFRQIVKDSIEDTPLSDAEGEYLAAPVFEHLPGTRITSGLMADLRRRGVKSVKTAAGAPQVSPIMAPATRNPLLNPDWMARMGHRLLKQTLLDAAHQAHTSDIHGASPIPAMIYSAEFGEGFDGHY